MKKNAATSRQRERAAPRQLRAAGRSTRRRDAALAARQPEPEHGERRSRPRREDEQRRRASRRARARAAPRPPRRRRRADRDSRRVDAGREHGPVGEALLHADRAAARRRGPSRCRPGTSAGSTPRRARHERARDPKTPISASAAASACREPSRCERNGAGGANRPMQSTGIVPSRPATACETSRSSWIDGMQRADADELRPQRQRREEERGEKRRPPQSSDGLVEGALARLHRARRARRRRGAGSARSRRAPRTPPCRGTARRRGTSAGPPGPGTGCRASQPGSCAARARKLAG